jgi:hypothetical protein
LIYITVQAQVPWLEVMHEYAFSLSSPEALRAESGYFMTALAAAIQFIGTYGMEDDHIASDDHASGSDSEHSDDAVQRALHLPDATASTGGIAPAECGQQSPRFVVDDVSTGDQHRTPSKPATSSSTEPAAGTRHQSESIGDLVQSPLGAFSSFSDPALLDRDSDWGIPALGATRGPR